VPQRLHEVLVVGAGSIGERHVRCFRATGRARVSFVEVRESLRSEVAGRYEGVASFASLDAAMESPFDVAVIATPAPMHVPQAQQLVERGVNVLIEKPLSVTTDRVQSLIDAVARNRCVAGVAYVDRAHPVLTQMREAIRAGEFGRPVELVSVSGQHFPTYRPAYAQIYYTKHETGGGAVQDALTHAINAGQWLVGDIDRLVADLAHHSLNQHQAPNEMTLTVVCERGTARFEFHNNRWRSMTKPGGDWTDHGAAPMERDTMFIRQADAFLDAVEGKAPPLCTLAEGAATLRANIAILESARDGRWVSTRTEKT
jgi:predicted dehydrogenase